MNGIYAEQILFGYKNGHTLLSTSLKRRLKNQKDIEILSDVSGKGKFDSYITCFPLSEDGYYVFSKTWYAWEMERPGCVWTHMILIKFEDLINCKGKIEILKLFYRPQSTEDYEKYSKSIYCDIQYNTIDSLSCNYLIYTMFYSTKNVLIEDDAEKYERTIIDILTKLPMKILESMSVCTCSFSNRYINDRVFSYQITEKGNAKYLARDISDPIIYKRRELLSGYPLWVKYIANKFVENEQDDLYFFCEKYKYRDRNDMRELSKVLYSVNEFREKQDIGEFFNVIDKSEVRDILKNRTLEMLYFEEDLDVQGWFVEKSIIEQLVLEMQNKKGLFVKKKIRSEITFKYAKKIYDEYDKKRIRNIFEQFINKGLNQNGQRIAKEMIKLLRPNDLYKIFDMDINICSVLVRVDARFLLCKQIWLQDKNFQLELLYSAKFESISQKEAVIICIIKNTKKDIAGEVYELFGNEMLKVISEYCKKGEAFSHEQSKIWAPYLAREQDIYINLLLQIKDMNILYDIMDNVDSYSIVDDNELKVWTDLFSEKLGYIKEDKSYECAFFLLPIILKSENALAENLIEFVYKNIYSVLAKSSMDYNKWKKIDPLLPQVEIEQSWDKCLRLKMAFQNKFNDF